MNLQTHPATDATPAGTTQHLHLSISGVQCPLRARAPSLSGRPSVVGVLILLFGLRCSTHPCCVRAIPDRTPFLLRRRHSHGRVVSGSDLLCLIWEVRPTSAPPSRSSPRSQCARAGSVPSGAGSALLLVRSVSDGRVAARLYVRDPRRVRADPCVNARAPTPAHVPLVTELECPLRAPSAFAYDRHIRSDLDMGRGRTGRQEGVRAGVRRCVWRRAPAL